MLAGMIVVTLYSRRVYRAARPQPEKKATSLWLRSARAWIAYLVTIWFGLFLWGAYKTVMGTFEWQRAVPAGAFLLAFIALFSWALYKDFRRQRELTLPVEQKTRN